MTGRPGKSLKLKLKLNCTTARDVSSKQCVCTTLTRKVKSETSPSITNEGPKQFSACVDLRSHSQWDHALFCRRKTVGTVNMKLKQNWNNTETKHQWTLLTVSRLFCFSVISVLFQFHFNCADCLRTPQIIVQPSAKYHSQTVNGQTPINASTISETMYTCYAYVHPLPLPVAQLHRSICSNWFPGVSQGPVAQFVQIRVFFAVGGYMDR